MQASIVVSDSRFAAGVQSMLRRVRPEARIWCDPAGPVARRNADLLIVETCARASVEAGRSWLSHQPDKPLIMFTPTGGFDPISAGLYVLGKSMPPAEIEQALRLITAQL
ncbi:MAG: hypothetical protein RJA44_179 [Pseudomonadota bacterium]